ncbi:hemolysin D [soil metagenome]
MEKSLFSPRWYRIQALRPRLRNHVVLKRQYQRGVPWFVLIEPGSERVQRLNQAGYQFVGRCDGRLTVQQIWDELLAARPDQAMTQDEVLQLLVHLHDRGLIQCDVAPDVESIFRAQASQKRRFRRQGVNPLAFRLSLGDPSRLLDRLAGLAPVLFSNTTLVLWAAAVLAALIAAAMNWSELMPYAHKTLASPRYLFMTWLMYPVIKSVHELAHGLAVRRWGGQVRQAGVTLFMLSPVPFVNASAADGFRHRYQRAMVSAAGIMAELAMAAVALAVWFAVQPGLVRDLAFIVMLVGGMSTLLTNGNPLMRFDGYYFFCDILDLRNLATRSGRWWQVALARRLLGVTLPHGVEPLPGERGWLIAYAPLSWAYRLGLAVAIAMFIGGISTMLGLLTGVLMLFSVLIAPLGSLWSSVRRGAASDADRNRATWRGALVATAAVTLAAVVPMPFGTLAEGVVWLPERAQIRAGTEGFVASFAAQDGQRVKAGDLLLTLQDELLTAQRAGYVSEATELEVMLYDSMSADPQRTPAIEQKLGFARAEITRIEQKQSQLEIRAQADGIVVMPHQAELLGSFHKKGESLGHLLTDDPLTVRVALPQQDATLVRTQAGAVKVSLAEDGHTDRSARIRQDMTGAVEQLPSAALGDRGGGRIATNGDDKDGLVPRSPVVLMDLAVATATGHERIGGRALVRFDHGWLPLGAQLLRKLQQQVLARFNPGA